MGACSTQTCASVANEAEALIGYLSACWGREGWETNSQLSVT